ncbi:MAG TPA: FAD-binding oxidoreductase [Blastocatellia bacterium]|nr:FAD-binding oxidoreductase [Blastocatellia bacterium]
MKKEFSSPGRLITPNEPGYGQACQEWNARIVTHPQEIVYCQHSQDVSEALTSALQRGLPFRARCGGHSYECFSMVDGGVVIDVTDLSTISVNKDRTVAVIGGGGRLRDVYSKLWQVGVTIPGGTCPPVGISGLTLGGGLGMLVRSRGLLIDSLLELEMVDAQGRVLTVNSTENPDLFWACRGGGGGNFGIVTSLTFRVEPISDVTVFNIAWKWSDLATALNAWQKWAPEIDNRISVLFVLLPKSAGTVIAFGEFDGPSQELRPLLEPLVSAGQPTQVLIQTMPYIDAVNTIATWEGDASTTTTNRVKGNTSFAVEPFDAQAVQTFEEWMAKAPSGAAPVIYALGGAIGKVAPDETAFVHRNARVLITFQSNWQDSTDDQENIEWVEGIHQAVQPYTTGGAYVNIPDRALENWPYAYYGDNFPRLMEVKRRYDPDNVFNFEQSIPVSLTPEEARALKLPESMVAAITNAPGA